eukprot:scaffold7724_cov27-Tisochrysis_lutea.AAC.2
MPGRRALLAPQSAPYPPHPRPQRRPPRQPLSALRAARPQLIHRLAIGWAGVAAACASSASGCAARQWRQIARQCRSGIHRLSRAPASMRANSQSSRRPCGSL